MILGAGMKRRELMVGLGAAAAWSLAARAQPTDRMRRIGVLIGGTAESDLEGQARIAAFRQSLQKLGWIDGRNVRIEIRWSAANSDNVRKYAAELAKLAPDVILASGASTVGILLQTTRTIPVVFVSVADPVGAGYVDSLAHPGGNATGFMQYEYNLTAKWLELLKQVAPRATRVAVLRDATVSAGIGQFAVIQAAAPSLGLDVRPVNVRDPAEIDRTITAFANAGGDGLIVTGSAPAQVHRELILSLAAKHKLPAVYWARFMVQGGGLISYGPNIIEQYRQTTTYIDRILKGEKPNDLPVQAPVSYELAINLKTAKTLGIEVPLSLQQRADEVIE